MPVRIRGGTIQDDGRGGLLYLAHSDGSKYGAWPFHVDGEDGFAFDRKVWSWENPGSGIDGVTLSPSLRSFADTAPAFHIYVVDGDVQHLDDCECGCG